MADDRARHIIEILKLAPGDRFEAGLIGGLCGNLRFATQTPTHLIFDEPHFDKAPRGPIPVRLLIGTPRPPTARRLLKDLTTLGCQEFHFVATDLGEKSYLQSTLWKEEFRSAEIEGAQQAKTTYIPPVNRHESLGKALRSIDEKFGTEEATRLYFDAEKPPLTGLLAQIPTYRPLFLAIGPERGWTERERTLFLRHGWQAAGLGNRTLRTETACALALGIVQLTWAEGN